MVTHQGIPHLANLHVRNTASEQAVEQGTGTVSIKPQATHVRDIKDGDTLPRGLVFVHDRRVLNRHLPASEIDHPRTLLLVPGIECSLI